MAGFRSFWALCACAFLLTSCGGGGGGSGSSSGGSSNGRGAFTLTGNSATFTVLQGFGPPPVPQTFTLTVTGKDVAVVGAAYPAGQTPAPWLNIGLSGAGPYTLSVEVISGAVAPGNYTTTFQVGTADAKGNILRTQNFTVSYTLDPPLSVSTNTVNRSYVFGAASRVEVVPISVTAPNRQWTITSDAPWLTVPAATQSGTKLVDATIDVSALAPGFYTARLSLANTAIPADDNEVNVTLVIAPASFAVSTQSFLFGGEDGRAARPSQQLNFSLATGDGIHPFDVSVNTDSGGPWLTLDRTTGTVGSAGTSVTVGVDRGQLPGGTYTAELTVSTNVYGTPFTETIPVTMNIEAHRIVVSAAGVAFSRVAGRDVLTRRLEVHSNMDPTTTWAATWDAPWLSVTPSGTVGDDLVLTATPGALASDTTHFATVTISSSNPGVENTETVRVGLYLSSAAPVDEMVLLGNRSVAASPVEPLFAVSTGTDIQLRNVYTNAIVRTLANVVDESGQMTFGADGRSLFVHDIPNLRVRELDVATGAVLRSFPAPKRDFYDQPGTGIAVIRPEGHATLVAPNVYFYDLDSGTEVVIPSYSFYAYTSFTPSPDQSLLTHDGGGAFHLERSALRGGSLVFEPNYFIYPRETYSREACFSPEGNVIYTASYRQIDGQGAITVAGMDIATQAMVREMPAYFWATAVQCSWNGLIVSGYSVGSPGGNLYDVLVQDGPSATQLAERNSDLSQGLYGYPNRQVQDHGLAISGDGTRLLSSYLTGGYFPVGVAFQTLPEPP